jgi:hypothetical protein
MYHTAGHGVSCSGNQLCSMVSQSSTVGCRISSARAQPSKTALTGQAMQLRVGQARNDVLPVGERDDAELRELS